MVSSVSRLPGVLVTAEENLGRQFSVGQTPAEPILIEMHTTSTSKIGHAFSQRHKDQGIDDNYRLPVGQPEAMRYPWQPSSGRVG